MKKIVQTRSKLNKLKKLFFSYLPFQNHYPQNILFILGCQRSGTTLISRVFDNILFAKVFGEYNRFANPPKGKRALRLRTVSELSKDLAIFNQPLKVMKPIVDSQIACRLLNEVENSSVLWVYRDFKEVALSNIKKFGENHGGYAHVEAIIKSDANNWRGENISEHTQKVIEQHAEKGLNALEASCLFWYARNRLFFEQKLEASDRVTLWKYDEFVASPKLLLDQLLQKLGYPISKTRVTREVSNQSIGNAKSIEISSDIADLCSALQVELDNVFFHQQNNIVHPKVIK